MCIEIPESAFITLGQSISLPVKGWVRVYDIDEDTNVLSTKITELEVTKLSRTTPQTTYDTFETDCFLDNVAAQGFFSPGKHTFYIAFANGHVQSRFRQAIEACRGDRSAEQATDVDSNLDLVTPLLSSDLMRELLLGVALLCNHRPSCNTPGHARTIAAIASAGPPSTEPLTSCFRTYIDVLADGGHFLHPHAEAALLRGGWRQPRAGSLRALWGLGEDAFARDAGLEEDARDLLGQLVTMDYVRVEPELGGAAPELLRQLAQEGNVTALRLLLGNDGILPVEGVPAELRTDMLLRAVAAVRDERAPDRRDVISFLLEQAGVDPNGQDNHWAGARPGQGLLRQTALHIAMEGGDNDIVNLLLEHGASMDARDGVGRTPSERGPLL